MLVVGYMAANRDQGSDEEQILAVIERGRQAIERKSLDSAISCISNDFSGDGLLNRDRLRMLAAEAFRENRSYQVEVDTPRVEIGRDRARAGTHVLVTATGETGTERVFSGDVVLHMAKERVRRYLIFPAREWKVTGMEGISPITTDLAP